MEQVPRQHGSHLFTVRLWRETVSEGCSEWRGRVQHVLSGREQYFRDWSMLVAFLVDTLALEEGAACPDAQPDRPD